MASNVVHLTRVSRPLKKLEKPRPLNISGPNRHSFNETRLGTVEEIMALSDSVAANLANGNYDKNLKSSIKSLNSFLKLYGSKLETIYKDQLDRSFVTFRNGCRDDSLDQNSRLLLLELIELRAMQWHSQEATTYYKFKTNHETDMVTTPVDSNFSQPFFSQISPIAATPATPQPLILSPGDLVKSSGKYPAPTRVVGKNYCKDEVVIRNSDSGKVMGIKGRRVHMIEELSETVISFQRVSPGTKERLVQITGPTEDKINYAKQLMEDTIRRNASPVRGEGDPDRPGSSSSLNTDSDDGGGLVQLNTAGGRSSLLHSFSTNDASLGEYKYTVTIGDDNIKITGTNLDLVRTAKLVLDEYFSPDTNDQYEQFSFEEGQEMFQHIDPHPYLSTQESEESEETYKAQAESNDAKTLPKESPVNESPSNKKCAGEGLVSYTIEEIIHFADSPFSRQTPPNWAALSRDFFPVIFRKKPITWIDADTCLSRRPKESDWLNTKMPASSPPPHVPYVE